MNRALRSDLLLILTAAIWGFAFVAQRAGMEHVGPFTFNALRFAIGSIVLAGIILARRGRIREKVGSEAKDIRRIIAGGLFAGILLFLGASFQQIGIVYTTAGKAGFITGLYVVIVPIAGLLFRQKTGLWTWVGAGLGAIGLYFLSVTGRMGLSPGDGFVLIGSFMWAGHVLAIGRLSRKIEPLILALVQFAACSALSFVFWIVTEDASVGQIVLAAIPILYGGVMSVGIAFTLQVVAQRDSHPAHAAIIMSLEAVFAALGGWMILGETLSGRSLAGCGLMLAGMIVSSRKQA